MWNLAAALSMLIVTACYADTDDVVGGEPVQDGEFNFAVRVEVRVNKSQDFFLTCTGILLNNRTVLTVPYCFPPKEGQYENRTIRVTGGFYNLSDPMSTAQTRRVESYIIHPEYNSTEGRNMIVLLFLKEPFNTTGNPRFGFVEKYSTKKLDKQALTSSDAYFVGYGDTDPDEYSIPDVLHKLETSFVTFEKCKKMLERFELFDVKEKEMICTLNKKSGPCTGDAGGAYGFFKKRKFVVVGMLAWGVAWNCNNGRSVAMRMSYYKKWINANLAGDAAQTMD